MRSYRRPHGGLTGQLLMKWLIGLGRLIGNTMDSKGNTTGHRSSARQRGYDHRWDKARLIYLRQNPLCAMCWARGKIVPAKVVDHIRPHKGNHWLFWDETNWQPMCFDCHDSHKQSEEKLGYSKEIGADGWQTIVALSKACHRDIMAFNDRSSTTHTNILAVFDRAIAAAEAQT